MRINVAVPTIWMSDDSAERLHDFRTAAFERLAPISVELYIQIFGDEISKFGTKWQAKPLARASAQHQ